MKNVYGVESRGMKPPHMKPESPPLFLHLFVSKVIAHTTIEMRSNYYNAVCKVNLP